MILGNKQESSCIGEIHTDLIHTESQEGFSLIELLVTLTILSIALFIAAPNFSHLLSQIRGETAVNELSLAIKFAKSEAVVRRTNIRLCASSDQITCDAEGRWEMGWIIYMDIAGKSVRTDTDPILRVHNGLKNVTIRKNGQYLTVKLNISGQISLNRSFHICSKPDNRALHRLVLIHSGQIRISEEGIECLSS